MTRVIIELKPTAALFTAPESEEAQIQNLLLNIMGGLRMSELSEDERNLLIKHGYTGDFK